MIELCQQVLTLTERNESLEDAQRNRQDDMELTRSHYEQVIEKHEENINSLKEKTTSLQHLLAEKEKERDSAAKQKDMALTLVELKGQKNARNDHKFLQMKQVVKVLLRGEDAQLPNSLMSSLIPDD